LKIQNRLLAGFILIGAVFALAACAARPARPDFTEQECRDVCLNQNQSKKWRDKQALEQCVEVCVESAKAGGQ
jgi:hypothetical protein